MAVDRNLKMRTKSAQDAPAQRPGDVDPFSTVAWGSVFQTLNAVSTEAISPVTKELLNAGFEALDLLGIGLLVSSGSARLLAANQVGEQILRSGDGLEVNAESILSTVPGCGPSL